MSGYDIDQIIAQIKAAARGREVEILRDVAGIDPDILDPSREHPCPKCSGGNPESTRFRLVDQEDGAVHCSHCFKEKNGDFIAAVQWMRGISLTDSLKMIADYLHLGPIGNGKARPSKVTAVYDYKDEHGNLTSQVLRYEPGENGRSKDFKQRRPDGRDKWIWNVHGVRVIPYHLDEIVGRPGKLVVVAEGEKAVDALRKIGLTATCNAAGAGKWKPEHAAFLAGRRVVITPDNDDPGRQHAQAVARSLQGIAAEVRIVELPGLPEKGDAFEWVQGGGTKEKFRELVNAAPLWSPEGSQEASDNPDDDEDDSLVISAYDLVTTYTELSPPIIQGVLREGETMNLIAAAKMGKSWLANDLALSITTGRKWLGTFDTSPGKVLIVDNELPRTVLADRLRQIAKARNIGVDEYGRLIDFYTVRGHGKDLNAIGKRLQKYGPGALKLVIVDAWYRALPEGTDENDNADMAKAYNLVDSLALDFGCAFVLIHHASKGNQSAKSITDVGSGAGSQSRAADTHVILRPHKEPGVAVMEAVVRSWQPITPRCLRWKFPVWNLEESLNPADLKRETPNRQPDVSPVDQISFDAKKLIQILEELTEPITARQLRVRAGMNPDRFDLALDAISKRIIEVDCWGKNGRRYPGLVLKNPQETEAELEAEPAEQNASSASVSSTTSSGTGTLPLGTFRSVPLLVEEGTGNDSINPPSGVPLLCPDGSFHQPVEKITCDGWLRTECKKCSALLESDRKPETVG